MLTRAFDRLSRIFRPRPARPVGERGEREAERYLRKLGFRVLGRNVRTRVGEIDLLAEEPGRAVVVVEVKARVVPVGGARLPERSITRAKGRKLSRLAAGVGRMDRFRGRPVRIDVVAVEFVPDGAARIRHYPGAISATGSRT